MYRKISLNSAFLSSVLSVFSVFLTHFVYPQTSITDSLELQLKNAKASEKIFLLNELSWQFSFNDLGKGKQYSLQAIAEAEKSGNKKDMADSYNGLGIICMKNGEFEQGLEANFKALRIREQLNDKRGIAASKSKIGSIYIEQSKYEEALKYQLEALKIFEELDEKPAIGQTLNNICNVHKSMKDFPRMLEYALKALKVYEGMDFKYGTGSIYGNLGVYYQLTSRYDSSVFWNLRARELLLEVNALQEVSICDNNLGVTYRLMGENEKGIKYYREAYDLSKKNEDFAGMAQYAANLASVYKDMGKHTLAEPLLLEALAVAQKEKMHKLRSQIYDILADVYNGLGNTEKAFYYNRRFTLLKDSIFNDERLSKYADLEIKYETELKEKENRELTIKNQQQKIELQESEKDSLQKRNWIIASVLIALLILAAVVFYNYRNRQLEKNRHNEAIILQREEGLKAVFYATEEERKRIAKDLHDGVGQQLSALKMAWQKLSSEAGDEKQNKKITELAKLLDETASDVRSISHQMMPKVLSEVGLAAAVEDMLRKSLGNTAVQYEFEELLGEKRLHERVEISLYRICQELVNNIIKHSKATKVNVQLFFNKGFVILIVEDNGRGMEKGKGSEGMGMMNISSRLNTINGEINLEPGPESGTVATIRVPVI